MLNVLTLITVRIYFAAWRLGYSYLVFALVAVGILVAINSAWCRFGFGETVLAIWVYVTVWYGLWYNLIHFAFVTFWRFCANFFWWL